MRTWLELGNCGGKHEREGQMRVIGLGYFQGAV